MKLTEEERKFLIRDLKKYYSFVKECVKCKISYGIDTNNDNGLCPVCDKELKNEDRK